jgi:hypothetical protein
VKHKSALNPPSENQKLITLLPSISDYKHVPLSCSKTFFIVQKSNNITKVQALRKKEDLTNLLISHIGGQQKSACMVLHTLSDDFFPGWTILNSLMHTSIPPVGILCNITED